MSTSWVDTVYLFGSCAKGTATDNSDVDLLVITHDDVSDESHEAFDVLYGGTDDLPLDKYVSCDILTASTIDFINDATPLIRTVKKEGIELNGLL